MASSNANTGRSKRKKGSFLFGIFLIGAGITALWQNEIRFDVAKAAFKAAYTAEPSTTVPGDNFSYTGSFSPSPVVTDSYTGDLSGYLTVRRSAEIYAWDRETDSEGRERWSMRWQSSPESNGRNQGIVKRLSGASLLPTDYSLGNLTVSSREIRFVDDFVNLNPGQLTWQDTAITPTHTDGRYFHFPVSGSAGGGAQLGDERVSYRAIPAPSRATYFGRYDGSQGVVDDSGRRDGMINAIIQNEGLLHHLVSGERDAAINRIRSHEAKLKWYTRIGGTVAVVLGVQLLLTKLFSLLLLIPGIGYVVEKALGIVSIVLGLFLAFTTMALGFVVAKPLVLIGVLAVIAAGGYALIKRSAKRTDTLRDTVETAYAPQLQDSSMAEVEFIELARVAESDGEIGEAERKLLNRWARQRGWSPERAEELIAKALSGDADLPQATGKADMVSNLVRIALADGELSRKELERIRTVSAQAGVSETVVDAVIQQVRAEIKHA